MESQPIQPEDSNHDSANDSDSAYDDGGANESSTISLTSAILKYPELYGRTYHAYRSDLYPFPNDAPELEHIDLQHHICMISNNGKLFLAPISETPQNVLDVGTGTGIWAIEFGDQFPSASVVGTDLSPTQPIWVPPNVRFEIDDANDVWILPTKFDYVHCRHLYTTIEERNLFNQAYRALNPGGWFEIRETALPLQCYDDTLEGTALQGWCHEMLQLGRKHGMAFENPSKYRQWVEDAGFVNVQEVVQNLPISRWPKDERMKEIGMWNQQSLSDGLEAFSLKMWSEKADWCLEEYQKSLALVRTDIKDKKVHGYFQSFTVYGQKPYEPNL